MVPSPGDQDYQRTTDPFGKEMIISLTNGLRLFSCDGDDSILSSAFAIGHQVRPCLQSLPQNCPPGDDRCKRYRVVDPLTEVRAEGVNCGTSVRALGIRHPSVLSRLLLVGWPLPPPWMFWSVLNRANPAPVSCFYPIRNSNASHCVDGAMLLQYDPLTGLQSVEVEPRSL